MLDVSTRVRRERERERERRVQIKVGYREERVGFVKLGVCEVAFI
jgi:hypothetical protein